LDRAAVASSGATSPVERRSGRNRLAGWVRARTSWNPVSAPFAADLVARLASREPHARVLVIGGGTVGIGSERLYESPAIDLVAFDIYASPTTHAVADAHHIPLPDACVDAVWIQAVLEHVLDPSRVVAEIHRVLRPDGVVYAEIPFMQQVHEGAYDFTRFTEAGQRWLFRRFERLDSGVVAGPGLALSWSLDHLVRGLTRSRVLGRGVGIATSWLGLLDRLVPAPFASDSASCVYFYGRRAERALTPRELVRSYRGAQRPVSAADAP
ncbi:MAG TPA: class I SAM-dependent methyltransferase, partial [Dongiaceae bacterium]|nr:class I SAM-dependent methyltransferase [Dongiaceae bacterium]